VSDSCFGSNRTIRILKLSKSVSLMHSWLGGMEQKTEDASEDNK